MLPLETKQSGGKLLPHSDLREGVFLEEVSRSRKIEVCTGCWWGSLRERERGHEGDQDVDGRLILRWTFRKLEGVVGTGWSWLRIGTGGGHLWAW
jgi:hypothetical protein